MALQIIFGCPTGGRAYCIGWNYDHYPQEEITLIEANVSQVMSELISASFGRGATVSLTGLHSVWN